MSKRLMTNATRSPILYATTAGLSLGAVQALVQVLLFTVQRVWGLGDAALEDARSIAYIGLMGSIVGAVTWWLFVARRDPSEMSAWRGVMIGALTSLASRVILPISYFATVLLGALRTETVGDWFNVAGEGALLLVAGIIIQLLRGWMGVLAAMIVGGTLIPWYRRGAGRVASN